MSKGPTTITFFNHNGERYRVLPPGMLPPALDAYSVVRERDGTLTCTFLPQERGWLPKPAATNEAEARALFEAWMGQAPMAPPALQINVNPKQGLEIIRHLVRQYLPQVWIRLDELQAIVTPDAPATGHVAGCFAELACVTQHDVEAFAKRCILSSKRAAPDHEPTTFAILAEVWVPPVDVQFPIMLLLTSEMEVVFAVGTDAAVHPDGTIQVYGAEPGALVMTVEQYKAQHGRKLLRGTSIRSFALEQLGSDGTWSPAPCTLTLPPGVVRSMELTEK